MPELINKKVSVKIITEQKINPSKGHAEGGFPWRDWSIEVHLKKEEDPSLVLEHVTYNLHESFGDRASQDRFKAPFRLEEDGWGEFELNLVLHPVGGSDPVKLQHDLNFHKPRYEMTHDVVFKNFKKPKSSSVDMDKLAEGLQKLEEEDLLHVVQMIHDLKSEESFVRNDVENGEFFVDLYTLPDLLVKGLWEFTSLKIGF